MEHWTRNKRRSFLWTAKSPATWQDAFSRPYEADLRNWRSRVDMLVESDIEIVVSFICNESTGFGHNHARALLCRKLKHLEISKSKVARLALVIGNRLATGNFSEQFIDQLRLIAQKDISLLKHYCRRALEGSTKRHVIQFANRALCLPSCAAASRLRARHTAKGRARWVAGAVRAEKEAADEAGVAYRQARNHCSNSKTLVWFTDFTQRFWNSCGKSYPPELVEKAAQQESYDQTLLREAFEKLSNARYALRARQSIV